METYIGYLLLEQAEKSEHKQTIATMFINDLIPRLKMNADYITSGDMSIISGHAAVLG